MEFIARAGAIVDRAHRVAGILLLVVIVETIILVSQYYSNRELTVSMERMAKQMPVYVIPGSTRGIYSPTEDDLLINAFVDQVTQSFNTFTYENLSSQYNEMKNFFTAEMLAFSQDYFAKLIKDSQADRRSQLFVPDHSSMKVQKGYENGQEARLVSVKGNIQTIIAGSVVEGVPVEINLKLVKVVISKTNPFGFMLAAYSAKRAAPENPINPQPTESFGGLPALNIPKPGEVQPVQSNPNAFGGMPTTPSATTY